MKASLLRFNFLNQGWQTVPQRAGVAAGFVPTYPDHND